MNDFDENSLIIDLTVLTGRARAAFAAAAATRQLCSFERFSRKENVTGEGRPREIASHLWMCIRAETFDRELLVGDLDEVMSLLPEQSEVWSVDHALAEDALSSLAYAIRCMLSSLQQEAAWAARRAYEAADSAAIHALGVQPGSPDVELLIKSHDFVQRELSRQRRDLMLLRMGAIDEVQQHGFDESILTDEEAMALQ